MSEATAWVLCHQAVASFRHFDGTRATSWSDRATCPCQAWTVVAGHAGGYRSALSHMRWMWTRRRQREHEPIFTEFPRHRGHATTIEHFKTLEAFARRRAATPQTRPPQETGSDPWRQHSPIGRMRLRSAVAWRLHVASAHRTLWSVMLSVGARASKSTPNTHSLSTSRNSRGASCDGFYTCCSFGFASFMLSL